MFYVIHVIMSSGIGLRSVTLGNFCLQFIPPNPLALRLRVAEIEEMMEACPGLNLGPFSAEELASIVQRHALLIRSVKLGSKQSFSLSNILAGVGKSVQSA